MAGHNIARKLQISWLSFVSLAVIGCGAENHSLQDRVAKIEAQQVPSARLAALVELEASHPHAFPVEFSLGEFYLGVGDDAVAITYLEQAARLGRQPGVTKQQAEQAVLEYARTLILLRKAAEAIPVVTPLAARKDPSALLVRAEASYETGNAANAARDFAAAWSAKGVQLGPTDYRLYAEVLGSDKQYTQALDILRSGEQRYGFQPASGLLESSLYEKLGNVVMGILAAFRDTENQETQGALSAEQLEKNLQTLSVRTDIAGMSNVQPQLLIRGLTHYVRSEWKEAIGDFEQSFPVGADPFSRYLLLTATFETGQVTEQSLNEYAALEPWFRAYPSYYYHLWRAKSRSSAGYTLSSTQPILEKAVELAPLSAEAVESRIELGRLAGLDAEQSKALLIEPEIDFLYTRLLSGADPAATLGPIIRLVSIEKENLFSDYAVFMLKSAAGTLPRVHDYLVGIEQSSTGVLKARLGQAL